MNANVTLKNGSIKYFFCTSGVCGSGVLVGSISANIDTVWKIILEKVNSVWKLKLILNESRAITDCHSSNEQEQYYFHFDANSNEVWEK